MGLGDLYGVLESDMLAATGSIPILLYIKEVDSLRLIHPTSHHTFAYL
ncbi:MAG: hypothetical protein SCABRO_01245 [Candidatus Scalindua brodae]|uniref:Uncharacterized protein n=1 Tax=Candidatus Scalindua brodae TaxID=237368 RepID=A0A0B0EH67_9BACT|nr:MAG: hypothetical protein SCABRO_02884 [Candidatus Scalindua brodae]KHE93009.1 MAG: hypothetical protein SCABRO_01245 [Candidatus Scalindua brodae]